MPVFYGLMEHYPTPADLAAAKHDDLVEMIQHLGLQNQRAATCIKLAQAWLDTPPEKGKRYRRLHYPNKDDGKDIKATEGPIADDDERVAWEVGHLPGIGAYAIDSWRIFCRDELRGLRPHGLVADLLTTDESRRVELEGEWTRVLPRDKELRAYLRWRWLRVGWTWNPLTGERVVARGDEVAVAERGGVIWEGDGEEKGRWSVVGREEGVGAGTGTGTGTGMGWQECVGEGASEKMEVVHGEEEGNEDDSLG